MTSTEAAVDLVIFDLDGTLVDTVPDIAGALGAALAQIGVAPPPLAMVKEMVGDGARELARRALAHAGVEADLDALHAAFLAYYRDHVSDRSVVYPGVVEALETLRAAGVACAVLTNKAGDIARRVLQELALTKFFVATIGDGDGFPRKPDPTAALSMIADAGTRPARTAVVGDGLPDVRMGRALGARAIAAGWGYMPPERLAAESPDAVARTPGDAIRLVLGYPAGR